MGRTALAVMRCQPFHKGHAGIVDRMLHGYSSVIVGIGSTGRSREPHDPWTIQERTQMLRNVYGNRVKMVPLEDIGAEQGANTWCDYVLRKIDKLGMPEPTDYFTGSHGDAQWYKGRFWGGAEDDPLLQNPAMDNYWFNGILCRLHIMDRELNHVPAATDIRTFLETRSNEWKQWVPDVNHQLIEDTYPERFRVRLDQ